MELPRVWLLLLALLTQIPLACRTGGVGAASHWKETVLYTQDGIAIPTAVPPPDVLTTDASLRIKALVSGDKPLVSGEISATRELQRIRTENPELDAKRVALYYLALTYAAGGLTAKQYGDAVVAVLNVYGDSNDTSVSDGRFEAEGQALAPGQEVSLDPRTNKQLAIIGEMESIADKKFSLRAELDKILNRMQLFEETEPLIEEREVLADTAKSASDAARELGMVPMSGFRYCDYINYWGSRAELDLIASTSYWILGEHEMARRYADSGVSAATTTEQWISALESKCRDLGTTSLLRTSNYVQQNDFAPRAIEARMALQILGGNDVNIEASLGELRSECAERNSQYCKTFDPLRFPFIREAVSITTDSSLTRQREESATATPLGGS